MNVIKRVVELYVYGKMLGGYVEEGFSFCTALNVVIE